MKMKIMFCKDCPDYNGKDCCCPARPDWCDGCDGRCYDEEQDTAREITEFVLNGGAIE